MFLISPACVVLEKTWVSSFVSEESLAFVNPALKKKIFPSLHLPPAGPLGFWDLAYYFQQKEASRALPLEKTWGGVAVSSDPNTAARLSEMERGRGVTAGGS